MVQKGIGQSLAMLALPNSNVTFLVFPLLFLVLLPNASQSPSLCPGCHLPLQVPIILPVFLLQLPCPDPLPYHTLHCSSSPLLCSLFCLSISRERRTGSLGILNSSAQIWLEKQFRTVIKEKPLLSPRLKAWSVGTKP